MGEKGLLEGGEEKEKRGKGGKGEKREGKEEKMQIHLLQLTMKSFWNKYWFDQQVTHSCQDLHLESSTQRMDGCVTITPQELCFFCCFFFFLNENTNTQNIKHNVAIYKSLRL